MQRLLGDSVVDEIILGSIFLLHWPVSIRPSLAAMQGKPLSQLVQIADTLVEIAPPSIAALRPTPRTQSTSENCTRLAREMEHIQSKLLSLEDAVKPQTQPQLPEHIHHHLTQWFLLHFLDRQPAGIMTDVDPKLLNANLLASFRQTSTPAVSGECCWHIAQPPSSCHRLIIQSFFSC